MKKLILFLVFSISSSYYSQSTTVDALVPPQGFGIKLLNSAGNSSIINDVSNLGLMNPAAISNFDNYTIGISYQLNSDVENGWINDSKVIRKNDLIPQSAGAAIKWKQLTFGIGFGQSYNANVDFIWNSFNPGEQYITEFKGRVYSYSSAIAYSFNELLKDSKLDIGFNYSFHKVDFSNSDLYSATNLKDEAGNFSFGIQYSNKSQTGKETNIGFSYTLDTDFESEYTYSNATIIVRDNKSLNKISAANLITGNIPDQFSLDFSRDLSDQFKLNGSLMGVFWQRTNNNLKDQLEFSASMIYKVNEIFSPAFGFYYIDKNYKEDIFNLNEKFTAVYLTGGLKLVTKIFYADLAIADSHLFSGDFRKQTIGKLAIGVHL